MSAATLLMTFSHKNKQDEDDAANATCSEKAIDICCQALVCHFENPFGNNSTVEKKELMNATRRRGRAKAVADPGKRKGGC